MPTNKQRRESAQRHLQRQLDRRAELAQRRRRTMAVVAGLVALLVVAGVIALGTGVFDGDDDTAAAGSTAPTDTAPTSGAAGPSTNADGTVVCEYSPAEGGEIVDVGLPPDAEATETRGTVELVMQTNQGDLQLTLDRAIAPCAAASFQHLAEQDFFDDSPCHRLVTGETFGVLQCGDPTGTGTGGPSYRFLEEVTPETTYPRGVIAMANSGTPGSTGSQFFLVFTDSQLPPDYTVVGSVDQAGLEVLDAIAEAGHDGSMEPSPGGGAPNEPVTIEELQVVV